MIGKRYCNETRKMMQGICKWNIWSTWWWWRVIQGKWPTYQEIFHTGWRKDDLYRMHDWLRRGSGFFVHMINMSVYETDKTLETHISRTWSRITYYFKSDIKQIICYIYDMILLYQKVYNVPIGNLPPYEN